jgi:hypothetical protein
MLSATARASMPERSDRHSSQDMDSILPFVVHSESATIIF